METMLLNDPTKPPHQRVLEATLGKTFTVYEDLITAITDAGLLPAWNYYKDGKAWLCKVSYKKKTVFWLSIWDKYFKVAFYFTEKTGKGVFESDIDSTIKKNFRQARPVGRLLPLVITVTQKKQLDDVLKVIEYKKSLN